MLAPLRACVCVCICLRTGSRNADVAAFIRATDALVPATDVPDALQLVQKTAAQLLHALSSGDFDLDSNVCDSLVALVAKMSDRNVNQALLSVIKNAASTRISYQPIMVRGCFTYTLCMLSHECEWLGSSGDIDRYDEHLAHMYMCRGCPHVPMCVLRVREYPTALSWYV